MMEQLPSLAQEEEFSSSYTLASLLASEAREGLVIPSDGLKIWKKGLRSRDECRRYIVSNDLPRDHEYFMIPTMKFRM